jgi:hypothetical protein
MPLLRRQLGLPLFWHWETIAGGSRATLSKATIKGTRKGTKGGKKGQKHHPQRVTVATSSNNNDKEADDSDEEYVAAVEHDFRCQSPLLKDHF